MNREMTSEFDTVAGWTAEAVDLLGEDHAEPAGCRGSGSPAALAWLGDRLGLSPGRSLLDCGAGVGGPAAWARRTYGVDVTLTEPMRGACDAARQLFGLPCVQSNGQHLPFPDDLFDSVWCLGVLSTTTAKVELVKELGRVLRPGGDLGLLVMVQQVRGLAEEPAGNTFPRPVELPRLLAEADLEIFDQVRAEELASPPARWQARQQAVSDLMADRHGHETAWQDSEAQKQLLGRLIHAGQLDTVLLHAVKA